MPKPGTEKIVVTPERSKKLRRIMWEIFDRMKREGVLDALKDQQSVEKSGSIPKIKKIDTLSSSTKQIDFIQ
jgi:hypothetical protein